MKTFLDCIPCFVRQSLDSIRMTTDDDAIHERVLREALGMLSEMDMAQSPPAMAQRIHRMIRRLTENPDPYRQAKERFNALALHIYPDLEARVAAADDPLGMAVRLAIAGNVIDMGVNNHISDDHVHEAIDHAVSAPFDGDVAALAKAAEAAREILYLADNAGEIVFDRLLIEQLGPEKVTVAVKGSPILNDATIDDARTAGLTGWVEVIENGSDAPGTILDDCAESFRRRFEKADLVISKGQGNYETLNDVDKNIFFVLKVKCPVIARDLAAPLGSLALHRGGAA